MAQSGGNPDDERFATSASQITGFRASATSCLRNAEASLAVTFPPLHRGPRVDPLIDREICHRARQGGPRKKYATIAFVSSGPSRAKSRVRIVDATNCAVPIAPKAVSVEFADLRPAANYPQSAGNGNTFVLCGPSQRPNEFAWVRYRRPRLPRRGRISSRTRSKEIIIKGGRQSYRTKSKNSPGAPQEDAKAASWHLV